MPGWSILLTVQLHAIDMADENIRLNFGDDARHEAFRTDAFEFLNDIRESMTLLYSILLLLQNITMSLQMPCRDIRG